MNKQLFEALESVLENICGRGYDDDIGTCSKAYAVLDESRRRMDERYSVRCIETALLQRKLAHDLFRHAKRYEARYPFSGIGHCAAWYDAKTALRESIRWLQAARHARIREAMQDNREDHNDYQHAAE